MEQEMKPNPAYTEFHPKWYRSRVSTYWWGRRWAYLKFILRELSSVFVAYFVVVLLLQMRALVQGPIAYAAFQEWLKKPLLVALNTVSFFFVMFHTITWFNLAPKAIVLRLGGKRVSSWLIAATNYLGWLVVSAVMGWLILGG
jgi:fumarate reductase subunit C